MGLFFDLLSSINDPNTEGSVDQLSSAVSTIRQISEENGIEEGQMQTVLSTLGSTIRPMLKQQAAANDTSSVESMLGDLAQGGGGSALDGLVSGLLTQQIVGELSQKTGISEGQLQHIVPLLLPVLLNVLNVGKPKEGVSQGNPLLNSFLDSDGDGDVDLGDMFALSKRFLK
ncbi:MAG: DUF937 domain-containing protein [Microcystaceae cyanobacterium]